MRKVLCSKLKLPFANKGSHEKEEDAVNSLTRKANVREEYKEAFRTKSYIEISDKVQNHLVKVTSHDEEKFSAASSSSPSPPTTHNHILLSQYLLFPYQKPSTYNSISNKYFHQFFTNYFDITLEACTICESLLANINQARKNHLKIKKSIKIITRISSSTAAAEEEEEKYRVLYKNLASFAAQRNPFSTTNAARFLNLREAHVATFQELSSTCKKMKRRTTTLKLLKGAMVALVLMGFCALVAAALVLAMHCTAGLVAGPALAMLPWVVKKMKRFGQNCDEKWAEGLAAKLDVAARGVFIMINDFATMSRIVRRLEDEIEHRRFVADVCVRKGKKETLKEVVREFQVHESCFVEQLEELERQICLCFLDINRSKRMLVREMLK